MGFLNDEAMSQDIPVSKMTFITGTLTMTVASSVWSNNKTAGGTTSNIRIPIQPMGNSKSTQHRGSCVESIDIWWNNATANLTSITPTINKNTKPAYASAFGAVSAQTFTYDTDHNTAAKRYTQAAHKMTLTLDTPVWLDDDDVLNVDLEVVAAASSVFKVYDARVNFTLRL